jgi:hypothetical protein
MDFTISNWLCPE